MRKRRTRARRNGDGKTVGTLDGVRSGDRVEITDITDSRARVMALRFGMAEGAHVSCAVRIPAGPIVLRSGRQEIAVGRGLARRIHVRHVGCGRGKSDAGIAGRQN